MLLPQGKIRPISKYYQYFYLPSSRKGSSEMLDKPFCTLKSYLHKASCSTDSIHYAEPLSSFLQVYMTRDAIRRYPYFIHYFLRYVEKGGYTLFALKHFKC